MFGFSAKITLATVLVTSGALRDCGGGGNPPPPPPAPALERCDTTALDPVDIDAVTIDGDEITVDVAYSGGCNDHDFQLCWDGGWIKTSPMKVGLGLVHDANGDACRVWIEESLTFDLTLLADDTLAAYPNEDGLYVLLGDQSVWYGF